MYEKLNSIFSGDFHFWKNIVETFRKYCDTFSLNQEFYEQICEILEQKLQFAVLFPWKCIH